MKKIVLFDLDGTLVNTLPAIANSFNHILKKYGYKTYDLKDYKNFVGGGFLVLFDRINKIQKIKEDKDIFIKELREHYSENFLKGIIIYKGISELLDELTKLNLDIAIITNKDHDLAISHTNSILSKWNFKYIYGRSLEGKYPKKPNPYLLNEISKEYKKDEMLYVGDMLVDYEFSKNANIDMVYLKHGYGNLDIEKIDAPKIDNPLEILKYLE